MQEDAAVLVFDVDGWILVTDGDDETVREWPDLDSAMGELLADGWRVVQGPASIRTEMEGLESSELWGYRLKRQVQ